MSNTDVESKCIELDYNWDSNEISNANANSNFNVSDENHGVSTEDTN